MFYVAFSAGCKRTFTESLVIQQEGTLIRIPWKLGFNLNLRDTNQLPFLNPAWGIIPLTYPCLRHKTAPLENCKIIYFWDM